MPVLQYERFAAGRQKSIAGRLGGLHGSAGHDDYFVLDRIADSGGKKSLSGLQYARRLIKKRTSILPAFSYQNRFAR